MPHVRFVRQNTVLNNTKVPVFAELRAPGILHGPVRRFLRGVGSIDNAPPDDFDSVAAQDLLRGVRVDVDTAFILEKVRVDHVIRLDSSQFHDGIHPRRIVVPDMKRLEWWSVSVSARV